MSPCRWLTDESIEHGSDVFVMLTNLGFASVPLDMPQIFWCILMGNGVLALQNMSSLVILSLI